MPSRLVVAAAATLVGSACLVGCRPEEPIQTYRVAKARPAAPAGPPSAPPVTPTGEPTHRMIASIVPGSDQAWFFKAVGPVEQVDAAAQELKGWLRSVRLEDGRPTWDLPDGWRAGDERAMRLATLYAPAGDSELEISVIGLPVVGDWSSQVLDNVNRWRGQLSLPPVSAEGLGESTEPLDEVAGKAVLVDERGWFEAGAMAAPFAGPAAAPPSAPQAPAAPPQQTELRGDPPDDWSAAPGSAMRKASYKTSGGAEVTAFAFPASGAMGERLPNVNRWRGEVGLPPTTEQDLADSAESIELLGAEGSYFHLAGPEETTHAAMAVRGDQAWFFKLRGPTAEADAQRDAFRGWLASLSLE
ncbi:hypothetical protein [Botrimarina sp.]|uniref:hypothetical protein n=1 Tax=Botrimarina sp. TaxID=2795802 RepID=UPI0032EFF3DE